jgi:GAF domain-containing protein
MTEEVKALAEHLDEVTGALEALTATFDSDPDLGVILQAVCDQVTRVIPGADMASITLVRDEVPQTVASTDRRAVEIDSAQYTQGDGPCLRAAATGQIVRVEVGTAKELWPHFAEASLAVGVGSYLAAPLTVDKALSGAMNLFGYGTHGFRETEAKLLDLYTTVVVFGLRATRRYQSARGEVAQLRTALVSRSVIDQAKGILMAVHTLSAERAFQMLVARSQNENEKLHTVAARIVEQVSAGI